MKRPEYLDPNDTSGQASVAREGYENRKLKENTLQLKLRKGIQGDEHTRINKHNEGTCWGCMKKDYILSSLWMACKTCMDKRGFEALYTIVKHKSIEDTCDFCGLWSKPFECFQINAGLCDSCHDKVLRFHKSYREKGGKIQQPYTKRVRRKWGKDYKLLLQQAEPVRI